MKTKFYEFDQNNTGGSFTTDDKLCHRIFIEADNEQQAYNEAQRLGCYWNGVSAGQDCSCCGDRWYEPDVIDLETFDFSDQKFSNIEDYAQLLADKFIAWTDPDARVYYKDGTVVEIFGKTKTS